jgi:parvulin-like peptidyl-prolyl isomerase
MLDWKNVFLVMKLLSLFAFLCLGAVWAQTPPPAQPTMPNLPDDAVVAVFDDGVQFTFGDFKKVYAALPPESQRLALMDRKSFVQQWALMRKLAGMAVKDGIDQQSPTKELIEYNRFLVLMNAKLNQQLTSTQVEPNEIVNYYSLHKEDYKQVHLRAVYIAFGKKLTEDQAKTKAEKILAQVRGGGDFVKLVKENSDDETSRAKDGDFLTLHPGDNVPDALRSTVFKLKQGEVSDLVRQAGGYYIFRADEVSYRPLSQVRENIFTAIKEQHYKDWVEQTNKAINVQYTSPTFLGLIPAIGGQAIK